FLNLMETHMPFWPPGKYIDQVAPYIQTDREARQIMQTWNREAFRWAAPLEEPLSELEDRVLNDLYDAEVAYQDDYLGDLFAAIESRSRQRDTITIVVSDHGDGLGEHGYFGHAFVAYEELVHVPLIVHWPTVFPQGERIDTPVSTRRVFHTILDAATADVSPPRGQESANTQPSGSRTGENDKLEDLVAESSRLSLRQTIMGDDPENGAAFSEVYPPMNFVRLLEHRQPHLLESFRCLAVRRAVVQKDEHGSNVKLIHVDGVPDELFDLGDDPLELTDVMLKQPLTTTALDSLLKDMAETAVSSAITDDDANAVQPEDERLLQQLRGLGYIE
ncbi:MAG: sulfatase-like hydrolase/transferase, partial [Methylococcales bacterium]|nr:sulfatase-like hydrolase/transferase [Methylococcales bacterium]